MPSLTFPSARPAVIRPDRTTLLERWERKFVIPPSAFSYVWALLRHCARPDPTYPASRVTTIYYDDLELSAYFDALDGASIKNKVRVRWYDDVAAYQATHIFVELKSKEGFESRKRRVKVLVPGSALQEGASPEVVTREDLLKILLGFGFAPDKPLRPVLIVSYSRHRFQELATGISITYDTGITSAPLDRGSISFANAVTLEDTVLETKGRVIELPRALDALGRLELAWSGFSKYRVCLGVHLGQRGSFGWLRH